MPVRGDHLWARSSSNVVPRNSGDGVYATLSTQAIGMYVHNSGQTRIESTNWIRIRPVSGLLLVDRASADNLLWVYNSAGDDYVGTQSISAGTASYGLITTNKYYLRFNSKTGISAFWRGGVSNIIDIYNASSSLSIKFASSGNSYFNNGSLGIGSSGDSLATFHTFGSVAKQLNTYSSAITLSSSNNVVLASTGITVTLPSASGSTGLEYIIKNISTAGVTINVNSTSNLIDGSTSASLASQYEKIYIIAGNNNWNIISS